MSGNESSIAAPSSRLIMYSSDISGLSLSGSALIIISISTGFMSSAPVVSETGTDVTGVSVSIVSGTSGVSVISLWNTLVVIEISISAGVIADVTDVTFCSDSAVTISSAEVTDGTSGSFVIAL